MIRTFPGRRTFSPWLALLVGVAALAGCDAGHTDTGYEPHRLSMNGSQIRGLYAPEFSPEAQAAKEGQEQKDTMHNLRAGPGGF